MKRMLVALMACFLACSAYAGPIKGLVDVATGREVPDADARYMLSGSVTNATGVYSNLTVTSVLNLFGTTITNVDMSLLLYADGSQPYTANQNGGGFGITNLGSLLPSGSGTVDLGSAALPWRSLYANGVTATAVSAGSLTMTNAGVAIGSTNLGLAKVYISGEAGLYTNMPLLLLNRSVGATGNILQWGVNGGTNGYIDVNGDLVSTPILLTNSGTATLSATATQLVSITGMSGNMWSFRKPMLYSTNVPFSASADVSLFSSSTLSGDTEQWRANMAFASVYNTNAIALATNRLYLADCTPFQSIAIPFQAIIVDGTSNEVVTVTNVLSCSLILNYPTRYSHAVSNVVAHACTMNIPGILNDDLGSNTLRAYIQFQTTQTVGINYSIPYLRAK